MSVVVVNLWNITYLETQITNVSNVKYESFFNMYQSFCFSNESQNLLWTWVYSEATPPEHHQTKFTTFLLHVLSGFKAFIDISILKVQNAKMLNAEKHFS